MEVSNDEKLGEFTVKGRFALCYFYLPEIINADVLLVAIVVGAASGLTATGFNQVLKQLSKRKD